MNRIKLRYLSEADKKCVYELLQNSTVMKYLGPRRALTDEESADWFNSELQLPTRFVVALRESDEFIGFCGVKEIGGVLDFGYFLREKHWGQGYATEACKLALSNLSATIDLTEIEVFIANSNNASKGVARKLNWTRVSDMEKDGEPGYLYAVNL